MPVEPVLLPSLIQLNEIILNVKKKIKKKSFVHFTDSSSNVNNYRASQEHKHFQICYFYLFDCGNVPVRHRHLQPVLVHHASAGKHGQSGCYRIIRGRERLSVVVSRCFPLSADYRSLVASCTSSVTETSPFTASFPSAGIEPAAFSRRDAVTR